MQGFFPPQVPDKLQAAVADLSQRRLQGVLTLGDIVNVRGGVAGQDLPGADQHACTLLLSTPDYAPLHHLQGNPQAPERNGDEFELMASICDGLVRLAQNEQRAGRECLLQHQCFRPPPLPQNTHKGNLPAYHVVGNHCLSVPRASLLARLRIPASYYSALLAPGWRLMVLDTTEMSGHSGYPPESEQVREAAAFVVSHPMGREHPQMASWNGGTTQHQLSWLSKELKKAEAAGELVISASHHQVSMASMT